MAADGRSVLVRAIAGMGSGVRVASGCAGWRRSVSRNGGGSIAKSISHQHNPLASSWVT